MIYLGRERKWRMGALVCVCLLGLLGQGHGGDWPMYRKDSRRSAITDEALRFPLRKAWIYRCAQAPRPAWPAQPKLLHRVDYDAAAQLVVAEGLVCFGSSADDTVRALDLDTGRERWRFTAGGPVRLAPQIYRGKAYFAADDGWVYCLDARSGAAVWTFQAAPWDDCLIGNGRMISRWPCRTGVLVADDTVYATAGLFPNEGIYAYALDAATGEVRWQNDTAGFVGREFVDFFTGGHQGEFAFTGLCPEGALLLDRGILLVPQGHAGPARLDAHSGSILQRKERLAAAREYGQKLLKNHIQAGNPEPDRPLLERTVWSLADRSPGMPGGGGTWITIDQGKYYLLAMHRNRQTYLNACDVQTGAGGGLLHSDKLLPQLAADRTLRSIRPGRTSVVVKDGHIHGRNAFDLVWAGGMLLAGHDRKVSAMDAATGKETWTDTVHGEARCLAVAQGCLLVSTHTGEITCFAPHTEGSKAAAIYDARPSQNGGDWIELSGQEKATLEAIQEAGMDRGYVLVLGDDTGRLSRALARHTALSIVVAVPQRQQASALREKLLAETAWYGSRIHVHALDEPSVLPFAQFFANAVVVAAPVKTPAVEMYRVLRPCGGILMAPGLEREAAAAILAQTGAQGEELRRHGALKVVIRGALPGANDFDNRVPDRRVRWPLQSLWFGGPEPALLADDRSGEGLVQPPVAAFGRYFVQGETTLTAVDAYNGTVLWSRSAPKLSMDTRIVGAEMRTVENFGPPAVQVDKHRILLHMRRLTANRQRVYFHLGDSYFRGLGPGAVELDARTGRPLRVFAPYVAGPELSIESPKTWIFRFPADRDEPRTTMGVPSATPDTLEELTAAYYAAMRVESESEAARHLQPESGLLTLTADQESLLVRMRTREQVLTRLDGWDLFFDFRPLSQRYGLYDFGTVAIRVTPSGRHGPGIAWEPLSGSPHPAFVVQGRCTDTGTEITVRLPLAEVQRLFGATDGFGFAATYCSDPGEPPAGEGGKGLKKSRLRQRHLFGDARSQGLNAGWANVWLQVLKQPCARRSPAVLGGPYADAPKAWHAPAALVPGSIDPGLITAPRLHPLTGESGPRVYRSGTWGCGAPGYSATCIFRRASKPGLGIYDFADDSGLRFFGGISAPCHSSFIASQGLLLFSDSRFRCDCNPPIKTSLALAPAERVYNEDWAIFYDRQVDTRVRRAAINFGAFGDRRDGRGCLWLAYPRDFDRGYGYPLRPSPRVALETFSGVYLRHVPAGLSVPVSLEYDPSLGPYRMNSDRVVIENTDRPWLYASGIEGIRRAVIQLDFLKPLAATLAASPIEPDGILNEPAWQGAADACLPYTGAELLLRHDRDRLYLAARRPAIRGAKGSRIPWAKSAQARDGEVWKDDSLEVFLSDARAQKVVHLGVSASGAAYDALTTSEVEEDRTWTADWRWGVTADDSRLIMEVGVPLVALRNAGLDPAMLRINAMINQSDTRGDAARYPGAEGRNWQLPNPTSEALASLGAHGRGRCRHFVPLGLGTAPPYPQRRFTVRLHFAECRPVTKGQRVFGVKIQDETALTGFDVVERAGGVRRAVVQEFRNIPAAKQMILDFFADEKPRRSGPALPAILSALELAECDGP